MPVASGAFSAKSTAKRIFAHVELLQLGEDLRGEHLRRLMAPRGESPGCVEHGAPGLLLLLFKPRERIACVLDLLKLTFALLEVGQHVLDRGAVLLFQAVEPIQPALHVVKLMRRKIEALALILHRRRDVVDLAVDVLQPLIDLGEARRRGGAPRRWHPAPGAESPAHRSPRRRRLSSNRPRTRRR